MEYYFPPGICREFFFFPSALVNRREREEIARELLTTNGQLLCATPTRPLGSCCSSESQDLVIPTFVNSVPELRNKKVPLVGQKRTRRRKKCLSPVFSFRHAYRCSMRRDRMR
jgi:hypothetical protein